MQTHYFWKENGDNSKRALQDSKRPFCIETYENSFKNLNEMKKINIL